VIGDDALDAVFEEFGAPAVYIAPGAGAETPVTVRHVHLDLDHPQLGRTPFAVSRAQAVGALAVDVRRAELPVVADGAQLRLDGALYDIGRPEALGAQAQKWRLPLNLILEE